MNANRRSSPVVDAPPPEVPAPGDGHTMYLRGTGVKPGGGLPGDDRVGLLVPVTTGFLLLLDVDFHGLTAAVAALVEDREVMSRRKAGEA